MRLLSLLTGCLTAAVGFAFVDNAKGAILEGESVAANLAGLIPFAGGDLSLDGSTLSSIGVGQLQWNGSGLGNSPPFDGPFTTYCTDLTSTINLGNNYTFTIETNLALTPSLAAAGPTAAAFKSVELQNLFLDFGGTGDLQAFQLAIWNIIYDTDAAVDPGAGTFYVVDGSQFPGSIIPDADHYLTVVAAQSIGETGVIDPNVYALLGSDGAQSQIFVYVPEPASLSLLSLGGLSLLARRRARKA